MILNRATVNEQLTSSIRFCDFSIPIHVRVITWCRSDAGDMSMRYHRFVIYCIEEISVKRMAMIVECFFME